jgi:hypothetical protein
MARKTTPETLPTVDADPSDDGQTSLDLSPLANCRKQSTLARPMMGKGKACGLYLVSSDPGAVPIPLPKREKGVNGEPGESGEAFAARLAELVSRLDERCQIRHAEAIEAGMPAPEAFTYCQGWPAQVVGTADLVSMFGKFQGRNGLVEITRLPPEICPV